MGYKQAEKEIALGIIRRHGGMTQQAIADVRVALDRPGLSTGTLHRWMMGVPLAEEGQPATKTKTETKIENKKDATQQSAEKTLDDIFEQVARNYLAHALEEDVVKELKGKDAVIAAATAVDKMRLLRDLPTEIVDILPALLNAFKRRGASPREMFLAMLAEAEAEIPPGNNDLRQ